MSSTVLLVLVNSSVLARSLLTSAALLVSWLLYSPQHQPHDFCLSGWQRCGPKDWVLKAFLYNEFQIPKTEVSVFKFQLLPSIFLFPGT